MAVQTQCGINIDPSNERGRPSVQDLQDLGASWVRFVLKVKDGSPEALKSAFQSSIYGDYVSALHDAGIHILMLINNETVPGWPLGNLDPNAEDWQAYLARYEDRCKQIAQHYRGQVAAFQIWNEPDYAAPNAGYNPTLSPEVFGQMLKRSYAAIKGIDPGIQVVTGGLVSGNPVWLERVKASTGNKLYVDAVAVHPYGQRPATDWPWSGWGFGTLKGLLQEYFKRCQPLPVWVSEIGTDDLHCQGEFPERAYDTLSRILGAATVPVAIWFCWSDGMVQPFGLWDEAGHRKAAYASFLKYAKPPAGAPRRERAAKPAGGAQARLHATLRKAAARRRVVALDPSNALQSAILADGFVPNSAECGVEVGGVHYRVQRADDPRTGKARTYYAKGPSGVPITFVEQL